MHDEAADELLSRQAHQFGLVVPVIFIPESNELAVIIHNPAVLDWTTTNVMREVPDYSGSMLIFLCNEYVPALVKQGMD